MSSLTKIGNNLKKTRKSMNLRQIDIAKKAELNTSYYARIERGEINFSVNILGRVVKALKTTASKILPF